MERRFGTTRTVYLTKKYAFKFPVVSTWEHFIRGLLANMQETWLSRCKDIKYRDKLCPVKFSIWGGFLVVMPRCEELTEEEYDKFESEWTTWSGNKLIKDNEGVEYSFGSFPAEVKQDSYGKLGDKIVAVDFGN